MPRLDLISHRSVATCGAVSLVLAVVALLQQTTPNHSWSTIHRLASWEFIGVLGFMGLTAVRLHGTAIHPYVFFLGTCSFFLAGRFVTYVLGYDAPLFAELYFGPIALSLEEALRLVSITLACLLAFHGGYMLFWSTRASQALDAWRPRPIPAERRLVLPAVALLMIAAPLGLVGMVDRYPLIWKGEYVHLYQSNAEFATRLLPLANYGLLLAMGLAVASGHRTAQLLTTSCLGLFSLAYLGLGVRSAFMGFVLLAVWLVHKSVKRLRLAPLVVLPIVLVMLAQTIWAFSARSDQVGKGWTSRWVEMRKAVRIEEMMRFMHVQSVSLLSIAVADRTPHYPRPAYFQTFVPGFGVAAAAYGHRLDLADLYFAVHMAKTSLPDNYRNGETMGWSIVSDMLVFSQRQPAVFVLLSAFTGAGLAFLVFKAGMSALWFGALALIFPKLMLLPRAGLYSIIPYLEVFFVIAMVSLLLWRAMPAGLASRFDQLLQHKASA